METGKRLKIVCMSDTHNKTDQLVVPNGDVLIHAGDFTCTGSCRQVKHFDNFFSALPHQVKIVIAGNHDSSFDLESYSEIQGFYKKKIENPHKINSILAQYIYLNDSGVNILGYKVWGTSWIREFHKGAFTVNDKKVLEEKREGIPNDVDVLVSHCPPKGILDRDLGENELGCEFLLEKVKKIKPKCHVFGHIHQGYGVMYWNETIFVNASICNQKYRPVNSPVVIELPIIQGN